MVVKVESNHTEIENKRPALQDSCNDSDAKQTAGPIFGDLATWILEAGTLLLNGSQHPLAMESRHVTCLIAMRGTRKGIVMPPVNHLMSVACSLFGSTLYCLFSSQEHFPGSLARLVALFPRANRQTLRRIDFLLVISAGTALACVFCPHSSYAVCFISGLTWTAGIRTLVDSGGNSGGNHPLPTMEPAFSR